MSYWLKLTILLAFNFIGVAEAYSLHDMGLAWLMPIGIVTAYATVLVSWRWPEGATR